MTHSTRRGRLLVPMASLAVLALLPACCLIPGAAQKPPSTETMMPSARTLVTGSATYRERMTAPPGSQLKVVLADTSLADAPAVELASWTANLDEGGVPKRFELATEAALDPRRTYTVRATIHDGDGTLLWATDTAHRVPVSTGGSATYDIGEIVMVMLAAYSPMVDAPPVEGNWRIVSVGGNPAAGKKPLDLTLGTDGRVAGFSGCNNYGGSFKVTRNSLHFSPLIMTMMACSEAGVMQQEGLIGAALKGKVAYSFREDGRLVLAGADGTEIIAERAGPKLAGTSWKVDAMGGAAVIAGHEPKIEFSGDGKISGTTGCNRFFGGYTQSGETITFSGTGMTKMACLAEGVMAQEAKFVSILEGTASAVLDADGNLILMNESGVGFTARPKTEIQPGDPALLHGAEWIVEDINRGGVIDNSRLTLKFGADGKVSGSTNCNTFSGSYTVDGSTLTLGPLAMTRRACTAPALSNQESRYVAALDGPLSWELRPDGALELAGGERRVLLRR